MQSLVYTEPVKKSLAQLTENLDLADCIAVHVRRGNDVVGPLRDGVLSARQRSEYLLCYATKYVDISTYVRALDEIGDRSKAFIFSNDASEREALATALHPRIAFTMDDFADCTKHLNATQIDFIEQLAMSRTRLVLAPRSNYSDYACLLGNIDLIEVQPWLQPALMFGLIESTFEGAKDKQLVPDLLQIYCSLMAKQGRTEDAKLFAERALQIDR